MSKNNPGEQQPESDEARLVDAENEAWDKIKVPIIVLVIACLGGTGIYLYQWNAKQKAAIEARGALLEALDSEDQEISKLEALVNNYASAPASANALLKLAQLAQEEGTWDKALEYYEDFLSSFPEHPATPAVEYTLGMMQESLGQVEEAQATFLDLIDRTPTHPFFSASSYQAAKIAQSREDLAGARQLLTEVLAQGYGPYTGKAQQLLNDLPTPEAAGVSVEPSENASTKAASEETETTASSPPTE
ncbi:MAG: tetratricopeptide repeat protein [Verrucomicrobiota bacterium]